MLYFFRVFILYLILFTALGVGIKIGFYQWVAQDMKGDAPVLMEPSFHMAIQSHLIQNRQTETGLLLAGMVAQNRRDWTTAWKNFSALHDKYDQNPQIALRAMTLALGSGAYGDALKIAEGLQASYLTQVEAGGEAYDMVRLMLAFQSIKVQDYTTARKQISSLESEALSSFVKPIISVWVSAVEGDTSLSAPQDTLSPLQEYYHALALDYKGQNEMATAIFDRLSKENVSERQAITIAAYYDRIDQREKATTLLNRVAPVFNNPLIDQVLKRFESDETVSWPDYTVVHHKGVDSAIAMALHDFAILLEEQNALESALLFSRMAAYLDPQGPSFYYTIGRLLKDQGQKEEAFQAFLQTQAGDPSYLDSLSEAISIQMDDAAYDQAIERLNATIPMVSGMNLAKVYFLRGHVYRAQKQWENALADYNATENLARQVTEDGSLPDSLWAIHYMRAICLDMLDRWDESEKELTSALEEQPNHPVVLNYLGYTYADRNVNLDKAAEMIAKAVIQAPTDPYILDSMGWILYRMGNYDGAVQYLERAARLDPYHMVINDHLGDAYWQVGRKREAYYMWERAAENYDPEDEEQVRLIDETRRKLKEGLEPKEAGLQQSESGDKAP